MIEKRIEHIAYQLKQNKKNNEPGAIVFIGAGCSVSAGIPVASKIVAEVLEKHKDNPEIKCADANVDYQSLMKCLSPRDRKKIFQEYVDAAKINVSHIYLAYLLKKGYVDYIVTVNFDNLAQKALALYNEFPPTYDISVLKDLTTTTLDTKSIIYLHGQHNGLWQLNTPEEMNKIIDSNIAQSIFNKISNNRMWLVIGYSGNDFIFNQLVKLGRFDNGLFWVGYKKNDPSENVRKELLDKPNTESFIVKDYDSDSFFLKLNSELDKEDPNIFSSPFSFLSEVQNNIIDIEDSDEYKSIKERFVESKKMVADAIIRYEKSTEGLRMSESEIEKANLKRQLINSLANDKYEEIQKFEQTINEMKYDDLLPIISNYYFNWGLELMTLAETKDGIEKEKALVDTISKYKKAAEVNPGNHKAVVNLGATLLKLADTKESVDYENLLKEGIAKFEEALKTKSDDNEAYYNLGTALLKLADTKEGKECENLCIDSITKFKEALKIKSDDNEAYYNWGIALSKLAEIASGEESKNLLVEAIAKFEEALKIKPDDSEAYYNWGITLSKLAEINEGEEYEDLIVEANKKFEKSLRIKPDDNEAYNNWGIGLSRLAELKEGDERERLYLESFAKYKKAAEIKHDRHETYNNWGIGLGKLAELKEGNEREMLLRESFEKYAKTVEIKPEVHEAYYNWGTNLGSLAEVKEGEERERLYREAFEKHAKAVEIKPDYDKAYYNWGIGLVKLAELKEGEERDKLYKEAFEKLTKVVEINTDFQEAYSNYGSYLMKFAITKNEKEKDEMLKEAVELLIKGFTLGGRCYNLACANALLQNKAEAFKYLRIALEKKEMTFEYISTDSDWDALRDEPEYKELEKEFSSK